MVVVGGAQSSMTELSGMLGGVGLPAIVRFLAGLRKSGCLRLAHDDWTGEVHFESGEVTDAMLGSRRGLAALDGMVEMFPEAAFTFDSATPGDTAAERTIRLSTDELQQHIDATAARAASGGRRLPRADAVPTQTASDNGGEEPLPLDRGTLQTLLAVDGQRSVREIVSMRHSIESVWHLASLADVGLVHFNGKPSNGSGPSDSSSTPTLVSSAPVGADPSMQDTVVAPLFASTTPPRPEAPAATPVDHCPKLGFEDDPTNSFGRPTRLHRCFAAGTPMALSVDQQRELCLSDHFGTCPRLAAALANPPSRGAWPGPRRLDDSTREDGRIVRLPFGARGATSATSATSTTAVTTEREDPRTAADSPTPLHTAAPPTREATPTASAAPAAQPTPLRTRPAWPTGTPNGAAAVTTTATTLPASAPVAPPADAGRPPARHEQARAAARSESLYADGRRRVGQIPVVAIAAAGAVVLLLAALAYLLLPQLVPDNSGLDDNSLPNARLAAEGTPVTALVTPHPTPVAVATVLPGSEVDVEGAQVGQTAVPEPTGAPVQAAPAAQPTRALATTSGAQTASGAQPAAAGQPGGVPAQVSPTAAVSQPTMTTNQPVAGALFDDQFTTNDANWPSNPQALGQFTNGSYRMVTRQTGQSATIGAPLVRVPSDVRVTADFQKLGGPDGGGYGIIVRDQQQGVRDGSSQDGRYYVLEAGDKGEVGIWRRDGDHWVDLVPWQHADAVRTGTAPNELTVRAVGNTLSLMVNGTQVATQSDSTLTNGQVGLFVGGDGNQVAVTRFTVQNP